MTDYFMHPDTEEVTCEWCEGRGWVEHFKGDQAFKCECTYCAGEGVVEVESEE